MTRRSARVAKPKSHHFNPFVVIPTFFLGVATMFIAATVYAQINNEEITACVNNVNGNVRIPAAGTTCKNGESSLSWNKQGPKGDPGAGSNNSGLPTPFFCNSCSLSSYADKFTGKDFSRSQIIQSNFSNADLTGVNFKGSYFRSMVFDGANLTNANFSELKDIPGWDTIRNNKFNGANLTNANFSNSTHQSSEFKNANLQGVDFSNTTFKFGSFLGAQNMGTANVTGATWTGVICPDGSNSDANGGTCVGHF